MKKTFFAALFTLSFSLLFANDLVVKNPLTAFIDRTTGTKAIDMTVRSTGGSVVRIVGTISYSMAPAGIPAFTGTVTMTGGTGPNGSMAFAKDNKTLKMMFDSEDVARLRTIKWFGTPLSAQYVSILNDASVNNALVAIFNALA